MIPTPSRLNTGQASSSQTIPPPIGGLNGRDPIADMPATDAYLLDNWIPGTASVDSRTGSVNYSSAALAGPVQSLEVYSGGSGDKMLAWAGGHIYDVSAPVAVSLTSGLASNLAITTMFSNAADDSQHLMIANGVDTPKRFDGAALTDLALTGMTGSASTLNFVFAFKERLYWGQNGKLGFYYLPVGALQGALSYFDLGQFSKLGGSLTAIASFSDANGISPQDFIVFITSKGEYIMYEGFDPSDASNWNLVGRYYSAAPIGRKCTLNYSSELVILTLEGALPFSQIRQSGDVKSNSVAGSGYSALTSKLGTFLSNFNVNSNVPGWEGVQYTTQGNTGWLILNVPATSSIAGSYYHYIMNTTTNAWCRFTGWNGLCFAVFNRKLYFGCYDGYVVQGDVGRLDRGNDIKLDAKQAYNRFEDGSGLGNLQKHFQWAMLLVQCDGAPPLSARFNVDYVERQPEYVSSLDPGSAAPWDTTLWDTGMWGDDGHTQRFVATLNAGGLAGSLWLRAQLAGLTLKWYSTQFVMEKTKGLLI